MATFLTENSSFGLDGGSDSNLLASRKLNEETTGSQTIFPSNQHVDMKLKVMLDSGDLAQTSVVNYVLGEQYGKLPAPSADGHVFVGWYTAQNIKVEPTSLVELSDTELYSRWEHVTVNDGTFLDISTDSTYNKVRIYSAAMYRPATFSTAIPEKVVEWGDNITHVNTSAQTSAIYVDWGDGCVEKHLTSINKLVHAYENPGQYRAKVSNNITSIQFGSEIEMWYGVTDMNQALKDVVQLGSRVTVLPDYMFYHCGISSIDFLSTYNGSATSLPKYCFGQCENLTSMSSLPTRFKSLGGRCFYYSGLSGVVDLRGTGLTGLTNDCIFYGCQASTYKFPATMSASYFGSGTFYCNGNLTAVDLPSTLTSICGFGECYNLVSVSIPSRVKTIEYSAFKGCGRLSSVQCNTSALTGIYGYAFAGCQSLKSIVLPSTLTRIENHAFGGCHNLSSITDLRLTAQTPTSVMFGGSTSLVNDMYTGYSTRGNNVLSIYADAEGYDQGQWLDPLQNPDKCGFSIQYIDPENLK